MPLSLLEFVTRWKASVLNERNAAQSHFAQSRFIDLCDVLGDSNPRGASARRTPPLSVTAFSLLVLIERPHPTRLFLKKSRTSPPCPVQSRSENALAAKNKWIKEHL
jgi:hypothetical protein